MCIRDRGDIELNPGPADAYMWLQSRLAQQGLSTLDVGGAGDCFFRAVSHQLYGEPSYHMNICCFGVQYMRTNPERFIESIAGDLWARYLADMSQQGTWAKALVIQAVADAFHFTINTVETNERFAPHTVISPAIPGHEPTVINIGHVDELHYVSTIPYNEEMIETNLSCGSQYAQVIGSETVVNTLSQEDRKKRANKEFRDKERSANIEKIRESQRQPFTKQKESNPTHLRDVNRKAFLKTKGKNLEHVRVKKTIIC